MLPTTSVPVTDLISSSILSTFMVACATITLASLVVIVKRSFNGTYPYPYCFPPFGHGFGHDKMKDGMTWLILVSTTCCNLWEVPITTAFWIYSRTSSGEDEDPRNNILYTSNVQRPVNVIVVKKGRPIPRYQRRKEGIEQNLNSIPYCHTKRKKEKIAQ